MKEDTLHLLVLIILLILYMVIGAGIFSALEQEHEDRMKKHYNNIFLLFSRENNLTDSAVSRLLESHKEACLLGVGLDGVNKWDFAGAFYFTGTVITTIGFGLTAPSTFEGQIFFIFYALIGIPLNILFLNTALQKIVSMLSDLIRSGYNCMPKNKFFTPPGPKELPLAEMLVASFVIYALVTLLLATAFTLIEDWTFFQAIYFLIVACSTVGFGDYVPSKTRTSVGHNVHDGYRLANWFLIAIGLLLIYVVLNLLANFFKNVLSRCIDLCGMKICPCLKTQVEPFDSSTQRNRQSAIGGNRRAVSRISFANDLDANGRDLGSFAAIQVALDKLKMEASSDDHGSNTELKALTNIEKILQAEYFRIRSRKKSNSVKSRWKRAARLVRELSPKGEASSSNQSTNNNRNEASLKLDDANSYADLPGSLGN